MIGAMKAVIFDMDGVLINSEPLWRRAMIAGFGRFGMPATEDECRRTMGMRFGEVLVQWLTRYGKPLSLAGDVERSVMDDLLRLVREEGRPLPGTMECLGFCRDSNIRCGLATSSSSELMNAVLAKLGIEQYFDAALSAEYLQYGKPHPEVFLKCARVLGCEPQQCVVIEDSLNGVVAAKAASMQVIAVPDDEHLKADERRVKQFTLADYHAADLLEALNILKTNYSFGGEQNG